MRPAIAIATLNRQLRQLVAVAFPGLLRQAGTPQEVTLTLRFLTRGTLRSPITLLHLEVREVPQPPEAATKSRRKASR